MRRDTLWPLVALAANISLHVAAAPVGGNVETVTHTHTNTASGGTQTTTWTSTITQSSSSTPTGSTSKRTRTKSASQTSGTAQTASSKTAAPSASAGACSGSTNGTALSVPPSAPSSAPLVPGDFIGFGFETAFINDYANQFSENLVNSIANRVAGPLNIRVGGTTGDRVKFDPNQSKDKVCVSGDCPVGSSATYILGPSYFDGFKSFPNQKFSFQAPLGAKVNTTGSLDYVQRAYAAIGASRVDAIALGNEVDVYGGGYTVAQYVTAAKALESSIVQALNLPSGQRIFEVVDLSSGSNNGFTIQAAFQDGIDGNGLVKYAAQHWYQVPSSLTTYTPQTQQTNLMSHNAIVSKFNSGYSAGLQYIQQNDPNVYWEISESGSSLIGPPLSFQDSFGATLWEVDFLLYSMSQGVHNMHSTGRPAAPHSMWVPDDSTNSPSLGNEQNIGPQVRAPYYGLPMVADFLGTSSGRVTEVLGDDTATAYAIYDPSSNTLSKVALVNLNFWSADVGGNRGSITFDVPVGKGVDTVTVQRLQAAAGAHAIGYDNQGANGTITWAGETWSYQLDNGNGSPVSGVPAKETVQVCDGVASVTLPDSEAAVVFLSGGSS